MAARLRPGPRYRADGVFLNVPFDDEYEACFVALIAGVAGVGLVPACVLEVPASDQRLLRIFKLIQSCRYSIHDLSRVEPTGRYPRFNMPFEAGMASAWALTSRNHDRFVFEARRRRVAKTCSDLDGVDVKIHGGRAKGVLSAVLNAFTQPAWIASPAQLGGLHSLVRKKAIALKNEHKTVRCSSVPEPRRLCRRHRSGGANHGEGASESPRRLEPAAAAILPGWRQWAGVTGFSARPRQG